MSVQWVLVHQPVKLPRWLTVIAGSKCDVVMSVTKVRRSLRGLTLTHLGHPSVDNECSVVCPVQLSGKTATVTVAECLCAVCHERTNGISQHCFAWSIQMLSQI